MIFGSALKIFHRSYCKDWNQGSPFYVIVRILPAQHGLVNKPGEVDVVYYALPYGKLEDILK